MAFLEEIKRLGDNGKLLLGEFLTEVSELVPQKSFQGSSAQATFCTQ